MTPSLRAMIALFVPLDAYTHRTTSPPDGTSAAPPATISASMVTADAASLIPVSVTPRPPPPDDATELRVGAEPVELRVEGATAGFERRTVTSGGIALPSTDAGPGAYTMTYASDVALLTLRTRLPRGLLLPWCVNDTIEVMRACEDVPPFLRKCNTTVRDAGGKLLMRVAELPWLNVEPPDVANPKTEVGPETEMQPGWPAAGWSAFHVRIAVV